MGINDILTELSKSDYELNLTKIVKLSESDRNTIFLLFQELMECFYGERGMNLPGGTKIDLIRASIIYNTLNNSGYLVTKRERNIDNILDEDN
jgi:hypothetical protein